MSAKIEDTFSLDFLLVHMRIHVFEELLGGCIFKDRGGVFLEKQNMFFAEWSAKHETSSLVEKSAFAAFTWGTTDNTAMLVDFDPLNAFNTQPYHLKLCHPKQLKNFCP